jgi:hypothetical protein
MFAGPSPLGPSGTLSKVIPPSTRGGKFELEVWPFQSGSRADATITRESIDVKQ